MNKESTAFFSLIKYFKACHAKKNKVKSKENNAIIDFYLWFHLNKPDVWECWAPVTALIIRNNSNI